jgi:hypothetical protein
MKVSASSTATSRPILGWATIGILLLGAVLDIFAACCYLFILKDPIRPQQSASTTAIGD